VRTSTAPLESVSPVTAAHEHEQRQEAARLLREKVNMAHAHTQEGPCQMLGMLKEKEQEVGLQLHTTFL